MITKEDVIYISGGMTGYKNFNYPKFNRVAKELRDKGYTVVNPATDVKPMLLNGKEIGIGELHEMMDKGEISQDESWKCFLRGDIVKLMTDCTAIYLLKRWNKSKGARFERSCAKRMKFKEALEGEL